jgi:TolB-like protein/Flp pilus assembly protein TadD/predicted Ser/Thr protein kinase
VIGKTLVHYRILEKLGEGGMGAVYRAHDDRLQRDVAVKVLTSPDLVAARDRILREARTVSRLNHPGICTLHDVGSAEGVDFFVMELVEGRNLRDIVRTGPTDEAAVLDWGSQLVDAVREAHAAGIVHGDLKPGNIILSSAGRIKVLDFGLARVVRDVMDIEATVSFATSSHGGTIAYMAPERLRGSPSDERGDVFALGAILYSLLTGGAPFSGKTSAMVIDAILNQKPTPIRQLQQDVSEGLVALVERCLAKNPETRYASGVELALEFDAVRSGAVPAKPQDEEKAVAVLLFENLGGNPDDDYFCDGVTEDLITEISKIGSLRVFPRSSVAAFKGGDLEAAEIGRRLEASHIVEGSMRRAGERLRVTARLIRTDSGHTIWSDRFDRTLEDVFAIQDEIARNVAQALEVVLTDQEKRDLEKVVTLSFSAYDYYLRGRQEFNRIGMISSNDGLEYGISMYRKAIELDPEFAQAWAGIGEYRGIQSQWYYGGQEALRQADEATRRAMELDSELPEVVCARAQIVSLQGKWNEGRELFDGILERWPQFFDSYYLRGRLEFGVGNFEEAARFFRSGMEVRPDDVQCPKLLSMTLEVLGRDEEADAAAREGLRRVEKRLEVERNNPLLMDARAQVLIRLGRSNEALQSEEKALELAPDWPTLGYNAACLFAKLGKNERAISALVSLLESGFGSKDWIRRDPDLAEVREDPRVQRLLADDG